MRKRYDMSTKIKEKRKERKDKHKGIAHNEVMVGKLGRGGAGGGGVSNLVFYAQSTNTSEAKGGGAGRGGGDWGGGGGALN